MHESDEEVKQRELVRELASEGKNEESEGMRGTDCVSEKGRREKIKREEL